MTIRLKLLLFLLAFLLITVLFGIGSTVMFRNLTTNLGLMDQVVREHDLYENLKLAIANYASNVKGWAFTGKQEYRERYDDLRDTVIKSFGDVSVGPRKEKKLQEIGRRFDELRRIAEEVFNNRKPVGDVDVMYLVSELDRRELGIITSIEELETETISKIRRVIDQSRDIKERLSEFAAILVFFTLVSFVFLILLITRSIGRPFNRLLQYIDSLRSGEGDDALPEITGGEFGMIAGRFRDMVDRLKDSERKLKKRLSDTELFLEVTRIASSTLRLGDSFQMIVQEVSDRMGFNHLAIYLYDPASERFYLKASRDGVFKKGFSLEQDGICNSILKDPEGTGFISPSQEDVPFLREPAGSLYVVPVMKEGRCHGGIAVVLDENRGFTEGEVDVIRVLANSLSTIIRNAELYDSAVNQLGKVTLLYELSNALTTVFDIDELLNKVAIEVSRLFSARGCIIRMKEGDLLRIKAHYGIPPEIIEGMELKIGEGIAGKVAESGRPLLVEDVQEMPEDTRVPLLDVRTVVCVPIKIRDELVGTIGLYDKVGHHGGVVSFSYDDLKTTEGFGYIVSLALEKAEMFELQVRKEQEALEAKKRLDILFESVQSGIVNLDREYKIISANRYVEDFLDLKAEDIIGSDAVSVFHEREGGICPHCVAKLTFETGDINMITQSKGANYAELSSYPILDEKGKVVEAVVLIQDITDRVLYQEEIISLYREVAQTKDYLESLIDNSADAIVTTDLKGIVTSWNKGAERIYGYTEQEALGSFLPFIPDFLLDTEMQYIERIKAGETIRDIETMRKRKDGVMIEVSLTLSPIKDAAGEVIGVSGISRDISDKKRVEKELIRRNQELSRLFFISSAMRGTLELERLLRMVLTAVTMSDGLGFNRSILFLIDEEKGSLRGVLGVGPSTPEEAWQIWEQLSLEKKSLPEILREIEEGPLRKDSFLDRLSTGLEVSIDGTTGLAVAIREKRGINITDARSDPLSDPVIIQHLGSEAYALVPLVVRNRVIGVLWVDNYFNRKPITDEDMRFLSGFADQVASAIESARLFEQIKLAEAELENIFESISDLLYITTEDYTIRTINRAVEEKVGLRREEIVGKKCYEIFHGTDRPYEKCPHHKTVETKLPYIEEFDDPRSGGTTLTSTSPLFGDRGNFIGTVHIVRDISELKKLRTRLAQAEKMAALGEVAAKVAHEIRNPLVSIGGFSRRLEKKLDGSLKNYAQIITREVGRLEEILKDILSFVRDVRMRKEEVVITEVLNEVTSLYSQEMREKGVILERDYTDPLRIEVDPNRIKEALINIIGNAIQVLKGGGTVRVRTYKADEYGIIEVHDTGPGISEKDLPYIFDPFFTTKIEGTGLGLAITHRIIEQHNGRIEVQTEKGEGTTFRIYLPLKKDKTGGEEL